MHIRQAVVWIGSLCALMLIGACAPQPPKETHDGLVLKPDTRFGEVYIKPGASLQGYQHYGLAPCEVAFRKNWRRDQNLDRIDLSRRVTQEDVDRIKDQLSAECDKHFREALEKPPAYDLVEEFSSGEQVLILRPSIINLDINAPDTMSAGMSRTYTTSMGEMTLFLELVDATTGEVLARVVDRRRDMEDPYLTWTNSVTNRREAQRALRYWATSLRKALDQAVAM